MKEHSWPHTIRIIVFSCLIGGAAGVLGTALTSNYLSDYALELSKIAEPLTLTQERPQALPETYEDARGRMQQRGLNAVGTVIPSTTAASGRSIFEASVPALALTSDGWALTTQAVVGDEIQWGASVCEVTDVMTEPRYGWKFVRCDASNLPVVDMTSGLDVQAADQVFVVGPAGEMVFTYVQQVTWADALRSSDLPTRRILLQDDTRSEGSVAFNVYGEVIGLVELGGAIQPFEFIEGAFEQILEGTEAVTYPSLGVQAIDLTHAVGVSNEVSGGRHAGALIYGTRGIEPAGAAAEAGLLSGDLILSINGQVVNGTYALDDLVAQYRAGDQVRVEIERDGAPQEVLITLGERTQ